MNLQKIVSKENKAKKRILWLTDIHLNFISQSDKEKFIDLITDQNPDIILLGGDISDTQGLVYDLKLLEKRLKKPIYFVLGNHDFYHSSFNRVHEVITNLAKQSPYLIWLTDSSIIELNQETALIGHDSWADGRNGDYFNSTLMLNDYFFIKELTDLYLDERLKVLNKFGATAAMHFEKQLPIACKSYQQIILLTHVPPFREATWHRGRISDEEALPHFSCKAVGDVLIQVMKDHPECNLTVLCGHTHSSGVSQILPNLLTFTGYSKYRKPQIQKIFQIEQSKGAQFLKIL